MLTAWIPLQDSAASNGTLYVVDGSHRWPECEHVRDFNDPNLDHLAERIGREIPAQAVMPLKMSKGQLSFHHMRTLHASGPNHSGKPRFAVAVHLQDSANQYRSYSAADGKPVVLPHDNLCRSDSAGLPDYSDPAIFPVLWPLQSAD